MTTQTDALPACPSLKNVLDTVHGRAVHEGSVGMVSQVAAARAELAALCAPHALAASRAECERLRVALEEIIKAWDHKTGDYYVDNYLSDVEIDAARAALAIDRALENALFIDMSKKEPK